MRHCGDSRRFRFQRVMAEVGLLAMALLSGIGCDGARDEKVAAERVRVVGLHKLPFDQVAFDQEIKSVRDRDPRIVAQLREQYLENWKNAWIVVVEFDGELKELDFGAFGYAASDEALRDPRRMQVAYLEKLLDSPAGKTRVAFYLHFVDPSRPLWYLRRAIPFPRPTPPDPGLLKEMPYESPD